MDEQIDAAVEGFPHLVEHARDVVVRAHVARRHERRSDLRGELAHVLLDPPALEREGEPGAAVGEPPSNRPRDRALVGDAENEPRLPLERPGHARESMGFPKIFGYIARLAAPGRDRVSARGSGRGPRGYRRSSAGP